MRKIESCSVERGMGHGDTACIVRISETIAAISRLLVDMRSAC